MRARARRPPGCQSLRSLPREAWARASLPTPRGEPRFGVDRTPSRGDPQLKLKANLETAKAQRAARPRTAPRPLGEVARSAGEGGVSADEAPSPSAQSRSSAPSPARALAPAAAMIVSLR